MKDLETLYLECDCGHNDHLVKFTFTNADDYDSGYVYLSVQMNQWRPWYKRIALALGYIFGAESTFGHWDCTSLECAKLKELNAFIGKCIAECERAKNYN